ncbi:MAG: OFA family MFS transporter [Carbonactinosporaceae bacterium]
MRALAWFSRDSIVAPPGYSRWLIPPAALAVHLSIGQAYAYSVFKSPIETYFDVDKTASGWVFSIAIVMLGVSAAFGGTWVESRGPRKAMFLAACCFSGGFLISALGVVTHQIWLVYLGYGFVGGIGLGIGYISPVSTLIKWFPDRPGLATGMAIMGFGGGALIASPWSSSMLGAFGLESEGSVATAVPAAALVGPFVIHAVVYFAFMMFGVIMVRLPAPGWHPKGYDPATAQLRPMQTRADVNANQALRTPQFWLLWTVLFLNVTAGIGILEGAEPMILDFFGSEVSHAAAAGFVALLSFANMSGRIGWSATSDFLGRKPTYMMYLGVGALAYLLVTTVGQASLLLFVLLTVLMLSYYGGGFATVPAYLKDLFGTFQVGAIHGRLLTAWSAAGIAGPYIINAIADAQAAAGVTGAELYIPGLRIMVGLLVVGFIANWLIKPVSERHHMPAGHVEAELAVPAAGKDS